MKKEQYLKIIISTAVFLLVSLFGIDNEACAAGDVYNDKQSVLNYIKNLPNRDDKRVISGEYIGPGPAPSNGNPTIMSGIEKLYEQTGEWIGMVGGDYYWFLPDQTCNYAKVNPAMINYWKQGGLVTLTLHMCDPNNSDPNNVTCHYLKNNKAIDIQELLAMGTDSNNIFMRELKKIADGLTQLQNEGVIVLFRPYHEANGPFWWGGSLNKEAYKKIWQYTYNYFTNNRNLDNLIWIYSPIAKDWGILDFYPGDQYVDMVAFDAYTPNPETNSAIQYTYNLLLTTNKPIAFAEHGESANRSSLSGNYDFEKLIKAIKNKYPKVTFFQAWWTEFSIEQNSNARGLLGDPWVINRDDICIPGVDHHEQGCGSVPSAPTGLSVR